MRGFLVRNLLAALLLGFGFTLSVYAAELTPEEQTAALRATHARDVERWEIRTRMTRNLIKLVTPSVVHLESKSFKELPFGEASTTKFRRIEETGSGVIVDIENKKYVLTNRHIIAEVEPHTIRIHLHDRRVLEPVQVISNADFDIALIEISAENLQPADIGDSERLELADEVYAFGSPFGLHGSVSSGIISALGRRKIPRSGPGVPIQSFIQTDAAVNPGNSGGPLVNLRGEVVGIVTAIASSGGGNEGVAFAIPINGLMKCATQMARDGKIARPYLGINLDTRYVWEDASSAGLDRNIGAKVEGVVADSPGAKAGFQSGDIVLSYNGTTVEDDRHLIVLIALSEIGDTPAIEVFRNREKVKLSPRLIERR